MYRFRLIRQENHLYLKKKLSTTQKVNGLEVNLFSTKYLRGFMYPTYISENEIMFYSPDGSITLRKYLTRNVDCNIFFIIILQVLEVIKRIEENHFQYQNLVMDMDYVMISENSLELNFIYMPIISNDFNTSIFSIVNVFNFIEEIVRNTRVNGSCQFIHDFVNFINASDHYSITDIESYILRVQPNVYQTGYRVEQLNFSPKDKYDYAKQIYNQDISTPRTPQFDKNEGTILLEQEEGTTLLSCSDSTTVLTDTSYGNLHVFPYLTRIKTNEKIIVDKPVFRIGKEKSYVDYFVSDNNAVSRSHADIIKRNRKYFIYDNNSTNKTYVNGVPIPIQKEVEIYDSDQIVLGNETFEFKIQ